jgi:hypothetical protein
MVSVPYGMSESREFTRDSPVRKCNLSEVRILCIISLYRPDVSFIMETKQTKHITATVRKVTRDVIAGKSPEKTREHLEEVFESLDKHEFTLEPFHHVVVAYTVLTEVFDGKKFANRGEFDEMVEKVFEVLDKQVFRSNGVTVGQIEGPMDPDIVEFRWWDFRMEDYDEDDVVTSVLGYDSEDEEAYHKPATRNGVLLEFHRWMYGKRA